MEPGSRAGVANEGYWGMAVKEGESYELSFYARTSPDLNATVTATLESADGQKAHAKAEVAGVNGGWKALCVQPQVRRHRC